MTDRPEQLFATAATADQIDAGVGIIWWAKHAEGGYALTVLDYLIEEMPAVNSGWIGSLFKRSAELDTKHQPATRGCHLRVEHPGLIDVLLRAHSAFRDTRAADAIDRTAFNIGVIRDDETARWPATLDARADAIRPQVNTGKVVKLETGLRRFGFRAIKTNHLISQIKRHRPGDAASAGELLHAFVLGVLLGTAPKRTSWFSQPMPGAAKSSPPGSPFGPYFKGSRPF